LLWTIRITRIRRTAGNKKKVGKIGDGTFQARKEHQGSKEIRKTASTKTVKVQGGPGKEKKTKMTIGSLRQKNKARACGHRKSERRL